MNIMTKTKERTIQAPTEKNLKELGKIIDVPISSILANPNQPRSTFDTEELTKLAKSISQDGIIQPLLIRKCENGFELISGERRLRAAKMAGFRCVPCVLVDISDKRSAVIALIENIQRSDLNFFEEAQAISLLINKYSMTQEEAAIRLGIAQPTVANKLRLLKLSPDERRIISANHLTERHARALLKISDQNKRSDLLHKIVRDSMNVSETEKYIELALKDEKLKKSYKKRSPVLKDVRLFFNTVDKAVEVMKLAGVETEVKKVRQNGFIEYTIRIEDTSPDDQKL